MAVIVQVKEDLGAYFDLFAQDDYAVIYKCMRMSNPQNGMSLVLCPGPWTDSAPRVIWITSATSTKVERASQGVAGGYPGTL